MSALSFTDFSRLALAEFGDDSEFRAEVDDWAELPYLQMAGFARLAERAKETGDWDTYRRVMQLVATLWADADPGLRNALNVSFFEHIDFDGPRGPRAWALLSPRLQRAWKAMAAYNQWLHAGAKGTPPPEADV